MAIAKGNQTQESVVKRYTGFGTVVVSAFNPNKAELSTIYNREVDKDPEYIQDVEINGVKVKSALIRFIIKTVPEKNGGIETTQSANFFIRNARRMSQSGKFQVIDEYGRTAWVTPEQFEAKATVLTKNDGSTYQAQITSNYRAAYDGEEQLTNFIRTWLNIKNVTKFVNNSPAGMIDNPEEALVRLDHIADYFKGDFSEIRELLSYQPDNKLKVLFYVKNSDDNKQYQQVLTEMVISPNSTNYTKVSAFVEDRKNNGAYANCDFTFGELAEYVNTPTPVSAAQPAEAPAAPAPWFKANN